ncbi:protein translocase subunit SecDF [Mycoplasma todarodis]|uniref:Protein-export membrane protein SecF n=1 Tax=Mycoplasma todarodis TaxID=1937191 RepID=A0A4R0XL65_9MOLU|nr:protein translocase subunit SecDF [Mycoplasma todarodis]TCG11204.1 protein translocase subunit SecDF [Mycoplasma todarodis]
MKFFKWLKNKWVRIAILTTTLIGAILTITLGSALYTSKNTKTSIDYGGGASVTVQVIESNGEAANKEKTQQVFDNIVKRVDPLGINGVAQASTIGKNGYITISKAAIKTDEEMQEFEDLIKTKPTLSIYNLQDKSLFKNGLFVPGGVSPTEISGGKTIVHGTDNDYKVPFKENKAKAVQQNGSWVVSIELKNDQAAREWGKATTWMSKQKDKRMVVWMNHQGLLDKILNDMPTSGIIRQKFEQANQNLFRTISIPNSKGAMWNKLFVNEGLQPANTYAVSVASVNKPLFGNSFVITGNFNADSARKLAASINYGSANYDLQPKSTHFLTADYGQSAFRKALIAGIIVFALIAIFMMVNYGLLGALSTISIALYMFLTLTMFTVMRGEYSPETIAALIIGIGMSVDANIITFERLKSEVLDGATPNKAHSIANKLSLSTIFDANVTTLIVGFVLFYFGTASVKGFSIMLILSIVFTLFVMLLFTRLISTLLVKLKLFDNRTYLLGVRKKRIKAIANPKTEKLRNFDYMKHSKWFVVGSSLVVGASVIIFAVIAGIAGSMSRGINSSIEFSGGTIMSISANRENTKNGKYLSSSDAKLMKEALVKENIISTDDAEVLYKDQAKEQAILQIKSKNAIPNDQKFRDAITNYFKNKTNKLDPKNYSFEGQSVTSDVANALVKDAMIAIAIAMLAIVLYTLVRFKWTYSISAILALVHDGLIVTAVFVITRVEISPVFIAGLLSVLGYSINDTIVTFDRVREKMKQNVGELTKQKLRSIANEAIKDTIKRSLLTSFTTIVAVIVLMSFGNATKMAFNVAMLAGLVSGTYSSIFIATYAWVHLEAYSQKRSKARQQKNFWKLNGHEEQTVDGINDFRS